MPLFEVFIPATNPDAFNITAKVRAESWVQALRNGLARLGDSADVRNVMVDIKEDCIDVTEPSSGRVFRIKTLEESAPVAHAAGPATMAAPPVALGSRNTIVPRTPTTVPRTTVTPASAPPPAARPATVVPREAAAAQTKEDVAARIAAAQAPAPKPQRFQGAVGEVEVVQHKADPNAPRIGRAQDRGADRAMDDLLGELFQMTQALYDQPNLDAAANFVLDLAMRSVAADAGSVFISDINAMDLYFAAARGPKGPEVMKFRVPMGQGIVGFCAQEGVSLAVSDVQRDPRFCATISKSIGYEARSILCSPAQAEGRTFGAIELLNKTHGTSFTAGEVNVLNFLAHEFAEYMQNTGQGG